MLKNYSNKQIAIVLTIGWFLFNLLFSAFTVLADDEAYYWVYAKYLDWGYFDHPPMVALMIKAGTLFFNNEISIRFFTVLASTLTLWLLFKITDYKKSAQLFLLFLTVPAFHALGFMAVPDVPMLLFGTWYIYRFKEYLKQDSVKNILYLALAVALLMYSKYHGLLLVIFTLIPNYKIILKKSFYSVFVLSLVFFFPHIWWQLQNDLVSLKFHLFDRVSGAYEITFTTDYILGQLLFCGPILFILTVLNLKKGTEDFARTLKWIALGFYFFFLLMSFRSYIEANWVAMGYVAALLYLHQYVEIVWSKTLNYCCYIFAGALLGFRIFIILPVDKNKFDVTIQFGRGREFYENIHQIAGDRPVMFCNNYQKASKYLFYTGKPSFTINSYWYRRNQFDRWPIQRESQGKEVMCIGLQTFDKNIRTRVNGDTICYEINPVLKSYGYIDLKLDQEDIHVRAGEVYRGNLVCENIWKNEIKYDSTRVDIYAVLKGEDGKHLTPIKVAECEELRFYDGKKIPFVLPLSYPAGDYKVVFGIYSKYGNVLWNSPLYKLSVK